MEQPTQVPLHEESPPVGLLANLLIMVGAVAMISMMMHISIDVLARFLMGRSLFGTLEFVSYLYMIAVVYLPLAAIQIRREQIIVEFFSQWFSPRALWVTDVIAMFITIIYVGTILWWGFQEALRTLGREVIVIGNLDMPIWPTRWLLVIGLIALLVVLMSQFVRSLRAGPARHGSNTSNIEENR